MKRAINLCVLQTCSPPITGLRVQQQNVINDANCPTAPLHPPTRLQSSSQLSRSEARTDNQMAEAWS